MKSDKLKLFFLGFMLIFISCNTDQQVITNTNNPKLVTYKYLALGDSYTIGESVCIDCRFPEQLKTSLQNSFQNDAFSLQTIARTGWTTTNLITAVNSLQPRNDFDLVTLLIGVNNQYQNRPFALYEQEFPELVNKAISFAKGDKSNLVVVSIPDYAFTPFGRGAANISAALLQYNTFAKNYCDNNGIAFVNITDITQQGLIETNLVATDGLHPSQIAYARFVERILPKAIVVLRD